MLWLLTLLHLLVDGLCGAVLADYALRETALAPIVWNFGLYSAVAFGTQWCAGFALDRSPARTRGAFLVSAAALAAGSVSAAGIAAQAVLLGIGNSVFHAAGGRLVLAGTRSFRAPGIFVSSGAVGLALGLESLVPAAVFLGATVAVSALVFLRLRQGERAGCGEGPHWIAPARGAALACAALLFGCILLRGMGGGASAAAPALLFPCVFAAGKALGGMLCDAIGYRKTILGVFLLGAAALQIPGLAGAVLLALAFNMTMPLTLRLAHRCAPRLPGLMFGLAAGCLLPGVWLHGFVLPAQAMVTLQFLALAAAGWLIERGGGGPVEGRGR